MRATIVIPLLRQKTEWLRQSVESALSQTIPCEVIVVTAQETPADNRRALDAMASQSDRLRVMTAPGDCRFACSLNLGIHEARTERVGFLLADDWLQTDALERCIAHSEDIVATQMTIYDADGSTIFEVLEKTNEELARRRPVIEKAEYLGHFLLFDRHCLLAVGGVDPTIGTTGPDDFDLLWCLLESGATAKIVELPLYNYRDHTEAWRLTLQGANDQSENLDRILDKHAVPEASRDEIRRRHARWFGTTIGEVRRRQAAGT